MSEPIKTKAGMRVRLLREWNHIPQGSEATLGRKFKDGVGLTRIPVGFDRCPHLAFTMSGPAVEEELETLDGKRLMLVYLK